MQYEFSIEVLDFKQMMDNVHERKSFLTLPLQAFTFNMVSCIDRAHFDSWCRISY